MLPFVEIRRHSVEAPWTYELLDAYQRTLAQGLEASSIEEGVPGRILISELAPVITLGRRECSQDLILPENELISSGISIFQTDRGGRATYHGPGQWVLFVVDRLDRMTGDRRGVRRAVEGLLETGRAVGEQFLGSQVHLKDGAATGIWTARGKLASVGVHIHHGVLLHGMALNGYRTRQSFQGLRPCGLDAQVDFLLPEPNEAQFQGIPELLVEELRRHFWIQG
jgi:lipoyl(octanoyl) transferase